MTTSQVLLIAVLAFVLGFFASDYRHRYLLDDASIDVLGNHDKKPLTNTGDELLPAIHHAPTTLPVVQDEWLQIDQLFAAQKFDQAILVLQHYLNTHPHFAPAWHLLAQAYQQQGRHTDAVAAWFRYLGLETDAQKIAEASVQLKKYLLGLYENPSIFSGDNTWLIEQLNALLDFSVNNSEIHLLLAASYVKAGDPYQAQYHALMAANDPATQKRAEAILAQLNGATLTDELTVPLIRFGSQFLVGLNIEGRPLRLLLDTGASISGVSSDFIAKNPSIVKASKPIRLNTANGAVNSYLFTVDSIALGDIVFYQHILAHLPMDAGNNFDGLLGVDILGRFDFVIDQNALLLRLKKRNE